MRDAAAGIVLALDSDLSGVERTSRPRVRLPAHAYRVQDGGRSPGGPRSLTMTTSERFPCVVVHGGNVSSTMW